MQLNPITRGVLVLASIALTTLALSSFAGSLVAAEKSPSEKWEKAIQAFVEEVQAKLPEVRIAYISRGPSSKPGRTEKMLKLNQLVKDCVANNQKLDYIEAFDSLAGPGGLPRPELYVSDKVHFSPAGYKIRADLVRPYLEKFKSSVP